MHTGVFHRHIVVYVERRGFQVLLFRLLALYCSELPLYIFNAFKLQISDNIEMSFVATKYKPSVSLLTDTYYTVVLVDYLIMSVGLILKLECN